MTQKFQRYRRLVLAVPYSAGGAADQTARMISTALGERLKTSGITLD